MTVGIREPLLLAPTFDLKPWGGRRLERYGKLLPDGAIGESLENGNTAQVVGGPFDGWPLALLVERCPGALLGTRGLAASGCFNDVPLLVKLIDALEDLSVQVHPDDAQAPAGKRGKTEAWLILDCEPGASLVTGLRETLDLARIEAQLTRRVIRPDDVFFVPAGTVHAIGGGVLLYEVQQACDVTYRLYDWGRLRETHLADANRVIRQGGEARLVQPLRINAHREILVACEYFALERWTFDGAASVRLPASPETFRVVTVLGESMSIGDRRFDRGSSIMLPADLPEIHCTGVGAALITYIPDLELDVMRPLLSVGHSRTAIDQLGMSGV